MEIVVSKSKKPDNKFDARVGNKQRFHLEKKGLPILQNIKIKNERIDI